jgi:hypothetical protein
MRKKTQKPKRKPGRPKQETVDSVVMQWAPVKLTKRELERATYEGALGAKDREIALLRGRVKDLEEGMARLDEELMAMTGERDSAEHLLAIIRATVGGSGA